MPRPPPSFLASTRRAASSDAAAVTRGDYARVTPADVAAFREIVGTSGVVTDPSALAPYNT